MRLHRIEAGTGPALVILHGLMGAARNWAGMVQTLSEGRRVVALDLPNHGASPWSETMDYPFLAAQVAEAIGDLGGRAAVLGHSMGGKAAMVLALTRPELVERLVVADIAPVAYTHTFAPYVRAMRAVPLGQVSRRAEVEAQLAARIPDPRVRAFLMQNLENGETGYRWRPNLAVLNAAMDDILAFPALREASRYEGPTLFLAGADSDYVLPDHLPQIHRLFPAARLESIPGAGHWLHADQPAAFTAALRRFLAE